jgi:cytoskeleton protein RodZ
MISRQVLELPETLAGWRKRKGISLAAIASQTKISPRYLEAIERGAFDKLPGGVYNLSYLRQYARAIQFDEEELVECYRSAMGVEDQAPEPGPSARRPIVRVLDRIFSPWVMAKFRSIPH